MWYNYDGLGKRRNKLFADPDDLHWYRWAGWSVLSEYDTTGASGWEVPAAAARVDVAGLAERGAGAAYAYRLHDHLGSVRGLLGASKAPLARYAYAPYGELNHGAGRPLRRGFTGHHWDAESGMYYAPFRYHMPGAGRWLSRDPLGFVDGPNVYGYVGGKPVRFADPLGLFCWGDLLPIAGGVALGVGVVMGALSLPAIAAGTTVLGLSGGQAALLGTGLAALGTVIEINHFRDTVDGYVEAPRDLFRAYTDRWDETLNPNSQKTIEAPPPKEPTDDPGCWFS